MKKLKLSTKITILVIFVVLISLSVVSLLISRWSISNIQREEEYRIMDIANIIANTQGIRNALNIKDPDGTIQKTVTSMLESTEHIEIIVVADMNGIRYAHPVPERIGEKFVGGDENRVIKQGESYVSEATGTLGQEIRAFTPVFNLNNKQIGFVMVGTFTHSIENAKEQALLTIILSSFIGLFIGVIGALALSLNIKETLLGLEPEEISELYVEKKGMLDAIHEGIIAIDKNYKITLVNDSAIKMLGIKDSNINGKNVTDIFPTSHLPQVLESGMAEYEQEQIINNTLIVTNRVPIVDNGKVIGAIATFRDKTQITRLAEEVTGVKQIINALRANTHEFMNKLHVILGLIQLEEYDLAKKYIIDESEKQQQIISVIIKKIKNPTIAALILGKFNRAKELGIRMNIGVNSYLDNEGNNINNNILITIIGNLVENSMDALSKSSKEDKVINLSIIDNKKELVIEVEDNGIGIPDKDIGYIFKRGFTSKEGNRGVGLSLVNEAVENLKGYINVDSKLNQFTRFVVNIPKE